MTSAESDGQTETEGPETEERAPVRGVFELAANGRARCRACGQALPKGDWRLGERTKNPFGEGETTYWFHLECGALRRPEVFVAACADPAPPAEVGAIGDLLPTATFGSEHRRASRVAGIGVAPSGRARCRHCRELIEKGSVRVELSVFNEGRFDPMGYLHVGCLTSYVGAPVPFERIRRLCEDLSEEQQTSLASQCSTAST